MHKYYVIDTLENDGAGKIIHRCDGPETARLYALRYAERYNNEWDDPINPGEILILTPVFTVRHKPVKAPLEVVEVSV